MLAPLANVAQPRAGRHAEQRQDRAVQRADRQPAEGRQLSRRHRRAEDPARSQTPAGRTRRPRRPARHLFAARPQPRRGDHPRRRARPARERDARPTCCVCVADATNLRLALRLVLELKQVGRPMLLALNMIDIARRRGIEIDLDRLSRGARRAGRRPRSRCAAAAPTICCAALDELARPTQPASRAQAPGSRRRRATCAPPSARPTASSRLRP